MTLLRYQIAARALLFALILDFSLPFAGWAAEGEEVSSPSETMPIAIERPGSASHVIDAKNDLDDLMNVFYQAPAAWRVSERE